MVPLIMFKQNLEAHGALRHIDEHFVRRASNTFWIRIFMEHSVLDHASLSAPLLFAGFTHKRSISNLPWAQISMEPEAKADPERGTREKEGGQQTKDEPTNLHEGSAATPVRAVDKIYQMLSL